ncbi:MAG: transposase [Acidobacteria bacterium]|nr:transposase [Acidobacteriota bacterium]
MSSRRDFIRSAAAGLAAPPPARKMIGIQVGAVSFVDEGVEAVLDIIQQRAYVNTLFLASFTYGRGIAGRQVPGQPLPDHGKQEYDLDFHGGNYAAVHPQYYANTVLKQTRAPDHGELDIIAALLPAARKRGIKLICWYEDVWRKDVPLIEQAQEKDLHGRNATTLCFNNPEVRNFWLALTEDYARSYDVDGLMWGCERQGALGNALGARHGGATSDPGRVTCFCRFCERKAREKGINFERVQEGYRALEQFVRQTRSGRRPADGAFVTFWRLLLRYPEILAWERFWTDSLRETYQAIYQKAHSIKPSLQVGWHIWHNNSFSPLYRAEQDWQELARYSDFLKVVMYHNCGGERLAGYIDSVAGTLFADVPKEQLLEFHYQVMDYRERAYADIPKTGLSSDYVFRETRRALEGVAGTKTLIWPGIDIDIPTAAASSKSTPEGTRAAVAAALKAGAHGVLLSRKYSEMRLANLSGAGQAIRGLG